MPDSRPVIRPVDYDSPGDRRVLVELLDAYAADPETGGGEAIAPDARERIADGLRAHPTALVLLAVDEGRVVGLAACFEGYSTFAARPVLNLHDLVVAPKSRGRGVGAALLEAVEAHARGRGCAWITLEVLGANAGAQRLYRRCGFTGGDSVSPRSAAMFWKKKLD
ncbi:MAG: GNAT family N-acetyltransferase [Planctomycetota bacterium]